MMITASNSFAQAHFETIDGLRYLIDEDAKAATLVANPDEKYSGDIVVPEKVMCRDGEKYPITSIDDYSFNGCSITSIEISNNINSIGQACFKDCSKLASVSLSSSITSLPQECFSGCYALKAISIPASIKKIGALCFFLCSNLTQINLASVEILGDYCFCCCYSLQDISLPATIKNLSKGCFSDCYSLLDIIIPSNVRDIGAECFNNCKNLKNIANSTSKCKITKCFCKSTLLELKNSIFFLVSH